MCFIQKFVTIYNKKFTLYANQALEYLSSCDLHVEIIIFDNQGAQTKELSTSWIRVLQIEHYLGCDNK